MIIVLGLVLLVTLVMRHLRVTGRVRKHAVSVRRFKGPITQLHLHIWGQ